MKKCGGKVLKKLYCGYSKILNAKKKGFAKFRKALLYFFAKIFAHFAFNFLVPRLRK